MKQITHFLFITIFSLFTSIVSAQVTYPTPVNDYVNDFANIIHEADKNNLLKKLESVEEQTGIEIVVVTINAMADYGYTQNTIEPFATALFNNWGVGHKDSNNGILVLVSKKDRQVRIELGIGYPSYYNELMKQVIDENMLPFLRTSDYSRAIYDGTQNVVGLVTEEVSWLHFYRWHLGAGVLAIICIAAGISCIRSGKKGWGWTFFTIAFFIISLIALFSGSKKSPGFGGGRSGGGGASGSW